MASVGANFLPGKGVQTILARLSQNTNLTPDFMNTMLPSEFAIETAAGKGGENEQLALDKKLEQKYESLWKLEPIYDAVWEAWCFISQLNSSPDTGLTPADPTMKALVQNGFVNMKRPTKVFRFRKNPALGEVVELEVSSEPVQIVFAPNSHRAGNTESIEKNIGMLLPGFRVPTGWAVEQDDTPERGQVFGKLPKAVGRRRISLWDLQKILSKMDFTRPHKWAHPTKEIKFNKPLEETYSKVLGVYVDLWITNERIQVTHGHGREVSGVFTNGLDYRLDLRLNYQVVFQYPLEYAMYATTARSPKEFIAPLFLGVHNNESFYWCNNSGGGSKTAGWRISSMEKVREANGARLKNMKITPKKRTNKEGYLILRDGRVAYIPNATDNIDHYTASVKSLWDKKNETIRPFEEATELHNTPIFTDWLQSKFTYSNNSGHLQVLDLSGSVPLDAVTIARHLNSKWDYDRYKPLRAYLEKVEERNPNLIESGIGFNRASAYVLGMYPDITFGELAGGMLTDMRESAIFEGKTENEISHFEHCCFQITKIARFAYDYILSDKTVAFDVAYFYMRFQLALLGEYGSKRKAYVKAYYEAINQNKVPMQSGEGFNKQHVLHNLPGITSLMPHQNDVVSCFDNSPQDVMLDCQPGGGKTIMIEIFITKGLKEGKFKRPIIVTKSQILVSQFASDLMKHSKGQLIPCPISLDILNRMRELGMNSEQLVQHFQNMPPNTVFITDYGFCSRKKDYDTAQMVEAVVYGSTVIEIYPNVELLKRVGFDCCILDESHTAKNLDAKLTDAVAEIATGAAYRVLSSGTIINDTLDDLEGQMANINPEVLGPKGWVAATLASQTSRSGKALSVSQENIKLAVNMMKPYVQRHTKKRREWAFLLPDPVERLYQVDLTPDQQKHYDLMVRESIEDMKKSLTKEQLKALESGDPAKEGLLIMKMRTYFAKCEVFLNAPDALSQIRNPKTGEFEYLTSFPLSEAWGKKINRVSPKSTMVNQLLHAHFNGGSVSGYNIPATPNAGVLVLCYNKEVSKHIFENLQNKGNAIHYSAGDNDALYKFQNDPKCLVIVADETSINTGVNLQKAGRVIRVQTLWSPGEQEQAVARGWRPDFENIFNRKEIAMDWILCSRTLDRAKTARLISKIITKARFDESENSSPEWHHFSNNTKDLEIINMSLKSLEYWSKEIKSDEAQDDPLYEYFAAYREFRKWENGEFFKARDRLRSLVEKETGRKITDDELKKLALRKTKQGDPIKGSKIGVYHPLVRGQTIPPKHGINFKPVAYLESDSGDDGDDSHEVETHQLTIGEHVWTEFGVGVVQKAGTRTSHVNVLEYGAVKLDNSLIYVPETPSERSKWKKMLKEKGPRTFVPTNRPARKIDQAMNESNFLKTLNKSFDAKTDLKKSALPTGLGVDDPNPLEVNPKQAKQADVKKAKKMPDGYLYASLLNGALFLYANAENTDGKYLRGFKSIDPQFGCRIKTFQAMEAMIRVLVKKFKIKPELVQQMELIAKRMKAGKGQLDFQTPNTFKDITHYMRVNHAPVKDPKELRPYVLVWEGKVYIVVNAVTQSRQKSVLRGIRVTNASPWEDWDPWYMLPVVNTGAALNKVKDLQKVLNIVNIKEVQADLAKIRTKAVKKPK